MSGCFSFNRPSIEIIGDTPKVKQFNFFRPNGTLSYTVDRMYDVPEIN